MDTTTGHTQAQKALPKNNNTRNKNAKAIKLPAMIPYEALSIMV